MKKIDSRTYIISLLIATILIIGTLFHWLESEYIMAIFLGILALISNRLIPGHGTIQASRKQVAKVLLTFAILYIALFYLVGIYVGFYRSNYSLSLTNMIYHLIPMMISIISVEIIRKKILVDEVYKTKIITFLLGTITDVYLYKNFYSLESLNSFLSFLGLIIFSAIANNLLYNYISNRYGKNPVIIYRLITALYIFFIPVIPNLHPYLRTYLRMLYPVIIYMYLERFYVEDPQRLSKKEETKNQIYMGIVSAITLIIVALISCKFHYGVLVIGSDSMQKSIEKGDVVLFKKTNELKKGDVIVFNSEDIKIVHRIIDMKNINGEMRYYTKGDANKVQDEGYVTKETLVGKTIGTIKYIGKPTLWLNGKFK